MTDKFNYAVNYLLSNEGGLYEDAATGEVSNFGISLRWLQGVRKGVTADTIRNLTRQNACDLYYNYWWLDTRIYTLPSDKLAAKVLDHAVNMGAKTAISLLQQCLNEPLEENDEKLVVDGEIGQKTLSAIERDLSFPDGEFGLLSSYVSALEDHYRDIASKNPLHGKDLNGWLRRAEKLPA